MNDQDETEHELSLPNGSKLKFEIPVELVISSSGYKYKPILKKNDSIQKKMQTINAKDAEMVGFLNYMNEHHQNVVHIDDSVDSFALSLKELGTKRPDWIWLISYPTQDIWIVDVKNKGIDPKYNNLTLDDNDIRKYENFLNTFKKEVLFCFIKNENGCYKKFYWVPLKTVKHKGQLKHKNNNINDTFYTIDPIYCLLTKFEENPLPKLQEKQEEWEKQ